MKILVTGGEGFIGYHLVERLINDGHDVWSIDNNLTSQPFDRIVAECKYMNANLCNPDSLVGLEDLDVIYHLAAIPRIQPSLKRPERTLYNNISSTISVLEFARKNDIKVIFASSSSVKGDELANPYTLSKKIGEELCQMYQIKFGVKLNIARFYNVYGPSMIGDSYYGTVLGIWLDRYKAGKPLKITGTGEQRRDFTHVFDIVQGLIDIEKKNTDQRLPFELGRGENFSLIELAMLFPGATLHFVDRPDGEAENTLCEYYSMALGWKPKYNVKDFIEEAIKEAK